MIVFYSGSDQKTDSEAVPNEVDELRPTTPLETSQSEPLQSKSSGGHAHSSPTSLGGTYKIKDGGKIIQVGGAVGVALQQVEELELLNESAVESRRQLNTAEEKLVTLSSISLLLLIPIDRLSRAQEEHRNLNLKIRYR